MGSTSLNGKQLLFVGFCHFFRALSGVPSPFEGFELLGEARQFAVQMRTGDVGINLCRAYRSMAQKARNSLNRHPVRKGQGRGKGVTRHMKGNALVDMGELHELS